MITKLIKFIESFKWDKDNVASDSITIYLSVNIFLPYIIY